MHDGRSRVGGASSSPRAGSASGIWAVSEDQWREWAAEAQWELKKFRELAGVSRSVFYRNFERVLGRKPRVWLTADRMRVAAEMLSRGGTVKAILDRLRFKTPQAFYRSFKRYHRRTTTQYLRHLAAARTSK